jgi:hypothetical protein
MCKLHSSAKADEASIEATNSALKALSKFKKESFKCSHLPLQVSQKNKTWLLIRISNRFKSGFNKNWDPD